MVAGADSIDDMALLRHGAMVRMFTGAYALSTLGSFLRSFTFGHIRQLDAVASRFLLALAGLAGMFSTPTTPTNGQYGLLDVDDTRSRCTATPSRARGSAAPGSAGSTRCWPPCPRPGWRR
jgi:hypothetical protein